MIPGPAELVAAVLEGAVDVLAERGWRQGPRTLPEILAGLRTGEPVSLDNALLLAATDPQRGDLDAVLSAATVALCEWIGTNPDAWPPSWRDYEAIAVDLTAWQDAPGRTVADVVRACYGAARLVHAMRRRVPQSVPEVLEAAAGLVESSLWRLGVAGSYRALSTAVLAVYAVLSDNRHWGRITEADRTIAIVASAVMADRLPGNVLAPWRTLALDLRAAAEQYRRIHQTTQDGGPPVSIPGKGGKR